MDAVMKQKVENDAAASLRSIVAKRGRNSALAEKAIRESQSFTDKEALDNRLIELVANDERDLLDQLDGRESRPPGWNSRRAAHARRHRRSLRKKFAAENHVRHQRSQPGAGAAGVGRARHLRGVHSPGLIVPGILGAIMALLGLSALSVLPINWLGAALLLLAFTLFILEAKFATHGILGAGGALSMVLGAVMLIDSPVPELRIHLSTAIALALPFSLITMLLLSLVLRARRNKVVTGSEGMIGEIGTAVTPLAPEGKDLCARRILECHRAVPGGRRQPRARHCHQPTQPHGGTHSPAERSLNMIDFTSFTTIVIIIVVLYLISSIKILREYERGVIFRLGRLLDQPKGPGIILVFAPIDRMVRVSLRIDTLEVPAQDVITRDNVTVKVNAVVYFRVLEPRLAIVEVSNFLYATSQLAQTTLRSVLGEVELDELLSQRDKLNVRLQSILDQHTSPWGVKVTMVEVKQVDLPEQMIRAIGRQAEAERERRAKIIHAEGEYSAAEKLAMAAKVIQEQPVAIQLRYLQTLVEIGTEKNTTIVFPLPLDILSSLERALSKMGEPSKPANPEEHEE
jgi:regulator of protease activity HflC (stomatin/prohibitin superfamily)